MRYERIGEPGPVEAHRPDIRQSIFQMHANNCVRNAEDAIKHLIAGKGVDTLTDEHRFGLAVWLGAAMKFDDGPSGLRMTTAGDVGFTLDGDMLTLHQVVNGKARAGALVNLAKARKALKAAVKKYAPPETAGAGNAA